MRSIRTVLSTSIALSLAALTLVGGSSPAQAADDPARFWMYFSAVDGKFEAYLDKGVGATKPADGSVEAFRYGTSADFPPHIAPRADLEEVSFESVCEHVEAADGKKRVAVVIDFGVEQDAAEGAEPPAPYAACAQVAPDATGLQVLDAVADVRSENTDFGPSLCAIDGYPSTGCFGTGAEISPADAGPVEFAIEGVDKESADDEDDSDLPLLLGAGAVVVLLGAGGVLVARRNKA